MATHAPFRGWRLLARKLRRSPWFTTASVVTLALGIGANVAIFAVVHGVLMKPLPFHQPERLVGVYHRGFGFSEGLNQSPATYFTYREESRTFEDIGMWDNTFAVVTGLDEPERVDAMFVSDGTFPILRAEPAIGRVFSAEDDSPGGAETVILSHGFWASRFGSDDEVLGRTLHINGRAREIIGVMPEDFRFLRFEPALWLPFRLDRSEVYVGNFSYQALARLRPGATIEAANNDVARMIPLAVEKFPNGMSLDNVQGAGIGPNVRPLKRDVTGDVGKVLWVLLGTVGLVLLIAWANLPVGNLHSSPRGARPASLRLPTSTPAYPF